MKYPYMEIGGLTVTYGDVVHRDLCDEIPFYVERQSDSDELDFDFAQGILPLCSVMKSKGFSEAELWDIESLMRDNMPVIYKETAERAGA